MTNSKRLTILTSEEITHLYGIPSFNDNERADFFYLESVERKIVDELASAAVRINFILQLGYFKARGYFFDFTFLEVRHDAWYIINRYFPETKFPKKQLSNYQHYTNKKRILALYNYAQAKSKDHLQLYDHAISLTKLHVSPLFIFEGLLKFCHEKRLVKPGYTTIQTLISKALQEEQQKLVNKISELLDKETQTFLDRLLEEDDTFYRLTLLKKDPKNFSTTEMRKELSKQQDLIDICLRTRHILPELNLSPKNMEHYANFAAYYTPYKLKRMKPSLSRLYLLCFAHDRFLKVNDHLVTFFIYRTRKFYNDAELLAREQMDKEENQKNKTLLKAGELARLYINQYLTDKDLRPAAFKIVPKEEIDQFVKELLKANSRKTRLIWKYIQAQSKSFILNLRPIFKAIQFESTPANPIEDGIEFMRTHLESKLSFMGYSYETIPTQFIPKALLTYITIRGSKNKHSKRKTIDGHPYEFMLYLQLQRQLEAGQVFVPLSTKHRSIEEDLIPYSDWANTWEQVLQQLNLPILQQPIKVMLKELNGLLSQRYKEINDNIKNGHNKHIKLRESKQNSISWRLPYKKQDEAVNNPFYENISNASLSEVVRFAIENTNFYKAFTPLFPHQAKKPMDLNALVAGIIAEGTGIGSRKMAGISDITMSSMDAIHSTYFLVFTLKEANDILVNEIAKLSIFKFYSLTDYGILASVDGQKVETKYQTFISRHSKKYFGFGKGISSYSLVANHVPINSKIIGANEHESHHLLDIVYNNSSDIKPAAISGDMHSINRVNFALLYLFGYQFMPRFTSLHQKAQESLVSFQNPDEYKDLFIKPSYKINENIIIKEWNNALRIVASLALKKTTQATIIRKLSSYKRLNPTLKALIEFDKIIMSLYMLSYIDLPDMRSQVHRSLNRGEAYHQLMAAIRKVSGNKIPGRNEIELEIHNQCTRLVANCIIFYNASILSCLYEYYERIGDKESCDLIKRLSPVAWQHINFVGRYEFYPKEKNIDLQQLIQDLLSSPKISFDHKNKV